jgi:hypothetical protein
MKEDQAKELRLLIESRLTEIYATLNVGEAPKRLRKVFARAAKKIGSEVSAHLKSEAKREQKRKKAELKALKAKRNKKQDKS